MAPEPSRAIDVALHEFDALRSEMTTTRTTQAAVLGAGLTLIGVVFAFALQDDGTKRALLLVPPLAFLLNLLHLGQSARLHRMGRYIAQSLWPYLQAQTTYPLSWEQHRSAVTWRSPRRWVYAALFDAAEQSLLVALSVGAIVYSEAAGWEAIFVWLIVLGTITITALYPVRLKNLRLE